jgi:hypothetical protein
MDKQNLARLKTVVIVLNCVVAALALLNLISVGAGAIRVDIPTKEDFTWDVDLEQHMVVFTGNFSVTNKGLYDIKNVDISAVLRDEKGGRLITYENEGLTIEAGQSRTFDIVALMKMDDLNLTQIVKLLLKDSIFYLDVDIEATYMWGLSTFKVDETLAYPWEAPVRQLYDMIRGMSLKDIVEYARPLQDGKLPGELGSLDDFDVGFDFDLDLFRDPIFIAYIDIGIGDMELGRVDFTYSLDTGWEYIIAQEVLVNLENNAAEGDA